MVVTYPIKDTNMMPLFRITGFLDFVHCPNPVSETYSQSYENNGRWTKSKNPVILNVVHHQTL
jgi:hypothetical protein